MSYSFHAPHSLNLFNKQQKGNLEEEVLLASIEIASCLQGKTLVYHPGRYIAEESFLYPRDWVEYTCEEKARFLEEECSVLTKAANDAAKGNLQIALENMRPFLDHKSYCYAVNPMELVSQVREIGKPNVGMTLDIGHLYLACPFYDFSLENVLTEISPYVIHMHIHDNFGKASYSTEKNQHELIPQGRGDMHMPIGNGDVPFEVIKEITMKEYKGMFIHELRNIYEKDWPEVISRWKANEASFVSKVRD